MLLNPKLVPKAMSDEPVPNLLSMVTAAGRRIGLAPISEFDRQPPPVAPRANTKGPGDSKGKPQLALLHFQDFDSSQLHARSSTASPAGCYATRVETR